MATTAQPQPPQRSTAEMLDKIAIGLMVCTPLVMLMPPRRLDLRFAALFATFSIAGNHLCERYTGRSVYTRFEDRMLSVFSRSPDLPEGAKRTQRLLREQKEREAAERGPGSPEKPSSILRDIWLGGEGEDWKQKRAEEHKKSFEEGKSMSDIILGQISDVFSGNWGNQPKKKDQDKETPSAEHRDEDKPKK